MTSQFAANLSSHWNVFEILELLKLRLCNCLNKNDRMTGQFAANMQHCMSKKTFKKYFVIDLPVLNWESRF